MNIKESVTNDLNALSGNDFLEYTKRLLSTLGYKSKKTRYYSGEPSEFFADARDTRASQNLVESVASLKLVFQLTDEEISKEQNHFYDNNFDSSRTESFYFVTAELKHHKYNPEYEEMAREINKHYERSPAVILFRVKNRLTIAFTNRRPNKRDKDRDVLEEVALISDICLDRPHDADVNILSGLSLEECIVWIENNGKKINFDGLLSAWLAKLDPEERIAKLWQDVEQAKTIDPQADTTLLQKKIDGLTEKYLKKSKKHV